MSEARMNKWEEQQAAYATEAAAALPDTSGNYFKVDGSTLIYKDTPVPDNTMEVVILDFLRENKFYPGVYRADSHDAPTCYAFGNDDDTRAPQEGCMDPQADLCKTCPWNEWGSAKNGNGGKECKNVMRLAMVPASNIAKGDIGLMTLSVTNVKNFTTFVKKVLTEQLKRPPFGVITRITVVPDKKNRYAVEFEVVDVISDPTVGEYIMQRRGETQLDKSYPSPDETKKTPATPNPRFTKKL